uniref:uncharacterized protein LOC109954684 n=1 Tax=Monopterus albus TaxID=43700 RepID=UPI0009B42B2B|nr:uncharacterized protein LOC109954684 [Monopterus albus]
MFLPLVVFLSTTVLHSVSAGGVYCAKTARARAAALGLNYPGVYGAPDLHVPHHARRPSTKPLRPHLYKNTHLEPAESDSHMAYYKRYYPGVRFLDNRRHEHARLRAPEFPFQPSYGTYNPIQHEYASKQAFALPKGQLVRNHKSYFEGVKHVSPPKWAEGPSQSDHVNWNHRGHTGPRSFGYNEHGLVDVPNRYSMPVSGHSPPWSNSHGAHQRGLTGRDLGREVPVLASSHFIKGHGGAMTSQDPVSARWLRFRFPGHPAQPLHRNLGVKQFIQGNPPFS